MTFESCVWLYQGASDLCWFFSESVNHWKNWNLGSRQEFTLLLLFLSLSEHNSKQQQRRQRRQKGNKNKTARLFWRLHSLFSRLVSFCLPRRWCDSTLWHDQPFCCFFANFVRLEGQVEMMIERLMLLLLKHWKPKAHRVECVQLEEPGRTPGAGSSSSAVQLLLHSEVYRLVINHNWYKIRLCMLCSGESERERARWPAHSHFLLPHFLLFSSFLLLLRSSVCLSVSRSRPGERLYDRGSSSSNSSSNVCSVFCVCVP